MRASVSESNGRLWYRISDVEPEAERSLKESHYRKENGAYVKSFPLPVTNTEKTKANFLKYAGKMFTEAVETRDFEWQKGLLHFAGIAKAAGIDWWTCGRIALALHGMEVEVNDLDFIFSSKELDKVNEAFQDYIVEPVTEGVYRTNWVKRFGTAYSHCPICFAFDPCDFVDMPEPTHFGPYASQHLDTVLWNGLELRVSPLDLHLKTYAKWGKAHIASQIGDFIKNKA